MEFVIRAAVLPRFEIPGKEAETAAGPVTTAEAITHVVPFCERAGRRYFLNCSWVGIGSAAMAASNLPRRIVKETQRLLAEPGLARFSPRVVFSGLSIEAIQRAVDYRTERVMTLLGKRIVARRALQDKVSLRVPEVV